MKKKVTIIEAVVFSHHVGALCGAFMQSKALRMMSPFVIAHTFCTSWDGLRNSGFLGIVPATVIQTHQKLFLGMYD